MRIASLIFLWSLSMSSLLWGDLQDGWVDYATKKIEELPEDPSFSEMQSLAIFMGVESTEPEVLEVKKKAWERLQQVPDFADRFATHLREVREEWVSERQSSPSPYYSERERTLGPMAKLPHPSVVRLLGGYLSDFEHPGYDGGDVDSRVEHSRIPSNAVLSARALGQLIEKPPMTKHWEKYTVEDARTWELWFAQVQAGTRTFRFKGDPKDYNLRGPVLKAVEPTDPNTGRGGSASPMSSPEAKPAMRFSIAALLGACGILIVALWYAFRRRMARAASG